MKIEELAKAVGAKILTKDFDKNTETDISTDTRTIKKGDFYLPLKGANFDGEKFIQQALEKGAIGAFCTKIPENTDGIFIEVPDTLTAYLQLANYQRKKRNYTVVAITGSSGKTTTKELVASTLASKYKVFKTPLNHNNEIGFCQTIFEAPEDTQVLVLEMGMRGLGEIELLSKYSEPDITIISNVGTAHIGRLGSRENIAKAKCEIVKYQRGKIFIAHDDKLIRNTVNFDGEKIFYSLNDVKILEKKQNYSKFEYRGNVFELNVGGDYNIENALSAINAGEQLGLSINEIQEGLKNYHPIEKRWEAVEAGGYKIINDSYNANPESMKAFINTVLDLYENYVLVLGDMGELGENQKEYHKEIGKYINEKPNLCGSATVITIGELSKNVSDEITKCQRAHFNSIEDAVTYIKENVKKDSILFLKASRSMKFEQIINCMN